MDKLIKIENHQTGIVKFDERAGIITLPTHHGTQTFEVIQTATKEIRAVLAASIAPKIETLSTAELESVVLTLITEGNLLLGHRNHLSSAHDLAIFSRAVANLIREKFEYRTTDEMKLIFKLGIRGDLKQKPDDVVFLNIEQIATWFKIYREKVKPHAIGYLKELPALPPAEPLSFAEWKERNPDAAKNHTAFVKEMEDKAKAEKRRQDTAKDSRRVAPPMNESNYLEMVKKQCQETEYSELLKWYAELKESPSKAAGGLIEIVGAELHSRDAAEFERQQNEKFNKNKNGKPETRKTGTTKATRKKSE